MIKLAFKMRQASRTKLSSTGLIGVPCSEVEAATLQLAAAKTLSNLFRK